MNKLRFEEDGGMYHIMDGMYIIGFIGFDEETNEWKDILFDRNNNLKNKIVGEKIKEVDDFLKKLNKE